MDDTPRTQPTPSASPLVTPEELRDFATRFSAFVDTMAEHSTAGNPATPSFRALLSDHLGGPAEEFEAVAKRFPVWRYADLDIGIEAVLGDERTVHGINTDEDSFDFTELIANRYDNFFPGAVQYESVPTGPEARRRCRLAPVISVSSSPTSRSSPAMTSPPKKCSPRSRRR